MSAVHVMRALLVAHTPLTALVPPSRIIVGILPQKTDLPAISISEVSGYEIATVSRNTPGSTQRVRVQVTVVANSVTSQQAVIKAAGLGPGVHSGVIAGMGVRSVLPIGTGPYLNNLDDDGIYEQSRDFMVTFVEPN